HTGSTDPIGYTGHNTIGATELIDMLARDYDPRLGRMLSADTIIPEVGNPQALNRYSYVYNNPVSYTDPSGHAATNEVTPGVQDLFDFYARSELFAQIGDRALSVVLFHPPPFFDILASSHERIEEAWLRCGQTSACGSPSEPEGQSSNDGTAD